MVFCALMSLALCTRVDTAIVDAATVTPDAPETEIERIGNFLHSWTDYEKAALEGLFRSKIYFKGDLLYTKNEKAGRCCSVSLVGDVARELQTRLTTLLANTDQALIKATEVPFSYLFIYHKVFACAIRSSGARESDIAALLSSPYSFPSRFKADTMALKLFKSVNQALKLALSLPATFYHEIGIYGDGTPMNDHYDSIVYVYARHVYGGCGIRDGFLDYIRVYSDRVLSNAPSDEEALADILLLVETFMSQSALRYADMGSIYADVREILSEGSCIHRDHIVSRLPSF
ncbi:hypothetical protein PAPHI01_2026 [Pancytospora philotis]|nr:hypothetical protein PAPHI01_2026 [Pancytospora philotis]